jgi:DNA-directed RNA polymerase specialized sigma24 family protein
VTATTWNDIPSDLQQRVLTKGFEAVGDLAAWAYTNRPCGARPDDLHDTLCALILFLLRGTSQAPGNRIRSLPAILSSIAYRQKCQRFRERASERKARAALMDVREESFVAPFARLAGVELRGSMKAALATLNSRAREAVLRKHVLGESYKEIARALFGPRAGRREEGHVSVILTRARRRLSRVLSDEYS